MSIGKAIGILATLITIVSGAIAIYLFVRPEPPPPPPPPPPRPESFLQSAAGPYSLASWIQANRPIELGISIPEGSLQVRDDGTMDWSVMLVQTHVKAPGRVRMTARGQIQVSTQRVVGVPGGKYNNTEYLDSRWGQVSSDVTLAVRGWTPGEQEDPFRLSLDKSSEGRVLLEMVNSRGTFTWTKQ
jgi:hypothetical protein